MGRPRTNHIRKTPATAPGTWKKKPLAAAISAAVATTGGASAAEIETVIVTATKREESAQDVTISVQAVTGDTVRELGIETFDEYAEYLPNVVSGGNGPGKRELYIRGSATEQSGVTITAARVRRPASRSTSTSSRCPSADATWTSSRRTWSGSRSCPVPRVPCSAPVPSPATCVSSHASPSPTSSTPGSTRGLPPRLTAPTAPARTASSTCRCPTPWPSGSWSTATARAAGWTTFPPPSRRAARSWTATTSPASARR